MAFLALIGAAPVNTGTLDIDFTNVRSKKGVLRICVTSDAKDFPDCRAGATAIKRTIPATSPSVRIEGLAHGTYAVAVIHDENSNSKLDTFLGMPREGFGFSRNPGIGFGPPKFRSAQFSVGAEAGRQQVRLRYLL